MNWLLIAVLMTAQGPVAYSEKFEFQYQCNFRLQELHKQYPGTTGSCKPS